MFLLKRTSLHATENAIHFKSFPFPPLYHCLLLYGQTQRYLEVHNSALLLRRSIEWHHIKLMFMVVLLALFRSTQDIVMSCYLDMHDGYVFIMVYNFALYWVLVPSVGNVQHTMKLIYIHVIEPHRFPCVFWTNLYYIFLKCGINIILLENGVNSFISRGLIPNIFISILTLNEII